YRDSSSRTSSASRVSESVVNPTRSANSTETRRRSDAGAATLVSAPSRGGAPTGVPHSSQNSAPGRSLVPHVAHWPASGAPHWKQNLPSDRFSAPQLGQI